MLEDSPENRFSKSNKTWTEYIREEIFKTMETEPWEPEFDIWKSIFKTWSQSEVRPRSPAAPTMAHMVQGESMYDPEYEKRSSKYHYEQCSGLDFHNLSFNQLVKIASTNDDKVLFLQLVKHIHTDLHIVCKLWSSLFKFDAVDCVAAVLDGETKDILEFPPCTLSGIADPMELAADFNAYRLINLLLDRFGPHVANIRDSGLRLPLNTALVNPSVDPTASIFEELWLICELYSRPKLESVRILAHHTEDLEKEFIKYAMEGKTREVVTLLLVARQKVLPLCSGLRKPILEEITSLHSHDVSSALTSGTDFFTRKRMSLQLILAWFEILEKVGDELLPYLRLPKDDETFHNELCDMLERAGFSIAYMNDYATNLSYRYLPELFRDQKIIMPCSLKHEGDIRDGAVIGVEGRFDPKVESELKESIGADDSNNFVSLVAHRMKRECLSEDNSLFAGELLRSICYHNSVQCAAMLLEGKTNVRIELNIALVDGSYPIHLAATSLSPGVTDLFLRHGAQTNVQCNNSSSPCYGMFPLELALEALRLHRCVGDWMPTKSIFKLIYIFCLPELMGPLKTIELLADDDIAIAQSICARSVQEGNLVKLCALLMVSWDKLVSLGHDGDIGCSFIGKHIISELQTLAMEEAKFICTKDTDGLQQARWKKGGLLVALSLLETFKRAGVAIQDYRKSSKVKDVANFEVPKDVSNLLRDLGFYLETDDIDIKDIKCLLRGVDSEQSEMAIGSEKDIAQPLKPCILPRPLETHEIYYDVQVKGHGKHFPMGSPPSPACQIPKPESFNQNGIPLLPRLNKLGYLPRQSASNPFIATKRSYSSCLPRQSSSSPVFETKRTCHSYLPSQSSSCHLYNTKRNWSFVAFASKRCLRFVRI